MIDKLPEDSFTWSRWRAFNLFNELNIAARYPDIIRFRETIRFHAIGYHHASRLRCRPKPDCYAIMFLKDGAFSWCHLTEKEFDETFRRIR